MTLADCALSFLISYIAGCVPNQRDRNFTKQLKNCFEKAVDDWEVPQETRFRVRNDMDKYINDLKPYVTNQTTGFHPKECELLKLWSDRILEDPVCKHFIEEAKLDIIQEETHKSYLKVNDIYKILQKQDERLVKIDEKVSRLLSRGVTPCKKYWDMYSTGDGYQLPLEMILSNRDVAKFKVWEVCDDPQVVEIEALSKKEAIAFVCASIISKQDGNDLRAFVVEDEQNLQELAGMDDPSMILITSLHFNPYYAKSQGHSFIRCVTPQDNSTCNNKLTLPELDKEQFCKSLEQSGFESSKARQISMDSHRSITALRRELGIEQEPFLWDNAEQNKIVIPALLLGSWDDSNQYDQELVTLVSGIDYASFASDLDALLIVEEPPVTKVGSIWRVKNPQDLMLRYIRNINEKHINVLRKVTAWLFDDEDPDALAKMETSELRFWENRMLFSGAIKEGVSQGITLIAVYSEKIGINTHAIDDILKNKYNEFTLEKYLSNRTNIIWMAEASPSAFLDFLESDIKKGTPIIKELFTPRKRDYDIVGTQIYYPELLSALESIAWNVDYLPAVTEIFLYLTQFGNDTKWSNSPINSLVGIFRLFIPQTHASFDDRLKLLCSLSDKYPEQISSLCYKIVVGVQGQMALLPNHHFRWRWADCMQDLSSCSMPTEKNICDIVELMLNHILFNEVNICSLLDVSVNKNLGKARQTIFDSVNEHRDRCMANANIVKCLRKIITHHSRFKTAVWALSAKELEPYKALLSEIEPKDVIKKTSSFFDDYLITGLYDEDDETDFSKARQKSREKRKELLDNIVREKGRSGVWELSIEASNKEAVALACSDLLGPSIVEDAYLMYCEEKLSQVFMQRYLSALHYQMGYDEYAKLLEPLSQISKEKLAIFYYAPEFQAKLYEAIKSLPDPIINEYWSNVHAWIVPKDYYSMVLEGWMKVGRYSEVLNFMCREDVRADISDEVKINTVYGMIGDPNHVVARETYYVAQLLKSVITPSDDALKGKLLFIELLMHKTLRDYMTDDELHLIKEINSNPDLLMQIACELYSPDEGIDEKDEDNNDIHKALARMSFDFLYHFHRVPCTYNGKIDEMKLEEYLAEIHRLCEKYHRTKVEPLIVGKLLGNFPETEDYPSDFLCKIVEAQNSDSVDSKISCALSNRRGMSTRRWDDGGDIERSHIETFKKYKERARMKSPRLVRVFDNEIKSYERMAEMEDNRAKLLGLKY